MDSSLARYAVVLTSISLGARMFCAPADTEVRSLLREPLLAPGTALKEIQEYVEPRIATMPPLGSRARWQRQAAALRRDVLSNVVFRGEAEKWRTAPGRVEWLEEIRGGPEYRIRKVRYEALPGWWIPALLYEPLTLRVKAPVVLNVNGHDPEGKAAKYKQIRCINQAKRGMLALNVEWFGMGQFQGGIGSHYTMNQLDLCGASGLAPFYLAMTRGLDLLLAHPLADPRRVAVMGLSGGGWQTIFVSALDERVTFANPVAGYSSFRTRVRQLSDLGDSEQTPNDLAQWADYTHLTALRAPRPTLLTFNAKDDCCFASGHALPPLLEAAAPVFALYGQPQNLRSHVNYDPGTHNFERENREAMYAMISEFFYGSAWNRPADAEPRFATEIPCDAELKGAAELLVPLPEPNATFNGLALELSRELPARGVQPRGNRRGPGRQTQRARLAELVQMKQFAVRPEKGGERMADDVGVTFWKLRLNESWTVPAVEFRPARVVETVVLVHDGGRAAAAEAVQGLLRANRRVVACDPFYFGESRIAQRDFLFAMLLASTGDRPLGLQAAQIAAVARWAGQDKPVRLMAVGPRLSVASLIAGALEEKGITAVTVEGAWTSLRTVIEQNIGANQMPEMFCFGLLREFDTADFKAMIAPRPVN